MFRAEGHERTARLDDRPAATRLEDLGAIGDGRSVALVSRDGAIEWLCWPRFDSDPFLARLLDPRGGVFQIAPSGRGRGRQSYVPDTTVLVTRWEDEEAALRLVDFMPAAREKEKARRLVPEHELVRVVTCERGQVELVVRFAPRPAFGSRPVRLRDLGPLGVVVDLGARLYRLRSDVALHLDADGGSARVSLRAGETRRFALSFSSEGPDVLAPLSGIDDALTRTIRWWRDWSSRSRYAGPYRDAVSRSALTLKLLSYAPSGAIVAAPTTSLPERRGGDLNWDYRFCWLRDAAYTVRVFLALGYVDEAEAFVSWMLHSTRLTRPELRVLYDVHGEAPTAERELPWLAGFDGSRPVRVGNAAMGQLQLDVYGEVIDATTRLVRAGLRLDGETQQMVREFGEWVCRHWERPDSGLWETREPPRHHTHSKAMCWVALDRLLELHGLGLVRRLPADRFAHNRALLRATIESRGWDARLGSYVQSFGSPVLDASLLRLGWHGYCGDDSPRLRGTWRQIRARLSPAPGLLFRYEQSIDAGEGAFGLCGFWAAQHLARGGGTYAEARAWYEAALGHASPLGLFAEELDPRDGSALGNFPQAFTHLGVVAAALSLERRAQQDTRARRSRSPFGALQ
jgi:GH15 family glucan-1,4-alpha-glucosidase